MYLEIETRKSKDNKPSYRLKISESFKVNGKSKKKTIRNVGTAKTEKEIEVLKIHGLKLIEIELEKRNGGQLFDATDSYDTCEITSKNMDYKRLKEEKRIHEGVHEVFGHLFDESGFNSILKGHQTEILKQVVISRIENPVSKRKTQEILERKCDFKTSLDSIYRMITALSKQTDALIKNTFNQAKSLFQDKLDIVFFDVTTLYFESVIQDELRDFGYSKDCKFHQTQIVLALAVTREGLPLGYKLFPGSTAETKTLISCLDEWKKYIEIQRIVFVADRGMFSYNNLSQLQKSGYEFIVACPLKKLKCEIKNQITDPEFFSTNKIRKIPHKILYTDPVSKELNELNGTLIISYTNDRAKKDTYDREQLLAKLNKLIGKSRTDVKKLISNKGYLKFTKLNGNTISELNEAKIEMEKKWDGIHGIFTNANMTEEEVLAKYKGLWQIEAAFRISKSDLSMRPIYHFTKKRIEGHIAVCFIALFLIKKSQILLEKNNIKLSPERLRMELEMVQSSIVYDKHTALRFRIPSNMSNIAKSIYSSLNVDRVLSVQKY